MNSAPSNKGPGRGWGLKSGQRVIKRRTRGKEAVSWRAGIGLRGGRKRSRSESAREKGKAGHIKVPKRALEETGKEG